MTKKKKAKIKGQKISRSHLRSVTLAFLKSNRDQKFGARQLIKKLKVGNNKTDMVNVLKELIKENQVNLVDEGRYQISGGKTFTKSKERGFTGGKTEVGVVDMTRTGSAYIVPELKSGDIYVSARNMSTAMNGDTVEVEILPSRRKRKEGKIVRVLERAVEAFLGTFQSFKSHAIVVPEGGYTNFDIFVLPNDTLDANDGDKVVVKIIEWKGTKNKTPRGRVTAVLGEAGSHDIEMKSILINNGFDIVFPEEVIREVEKIQGGISDEEVSKRRDFREVTTFTIDPFDAKDFDDALSIKELPDGGCEIGVHIADVTHYVKPGTELDKEAYERSTSVYLVDRVCPMLPEKLSNELCSLRPHEDSLCFSAVFKFDKNHKVTDRWFGKTLIYSDHRFAYEEAQEVIETGEGPFAAEVQKINMIAGKLRKEKFRNGAISFETDEVQFHLDENGAPIEIHLKERKEAHLMIEDFMLLANKEVAKFMATRDPGREVPYVYRVHDVPDQERVEEFARFARELGFEMKTNTPRDIADSLNRLAKEAAKNELLKLLEPIAIRTMSKAIYTTDNIGHYGLGFDHYTHFTSPIRRYSDVLVHRLLEKNLTEVFRTDKEKLEVKCRHISNQERKAVTAERESIKYKQVEFMANHIGEEFEGFVSGMIDAGIFVALRESKAEGLISFATMHEPFDVSEGRLEAKGRRSGESIKMGDKVIVKILDTNLSKRQIEMQLVEV